MLEWTSGLRALGKPPSLDSITRDTYPPAAAFGGLFIRRVARSIADATPRAPLSWVADTTARQRARAARATQFW